MRAAINALVARYSHAALMAVMAPIPARAASGELAR